MESVVDFNIQNHEANCNKKLRSFVGKLSQFANILEKHTVTLKEIAKNLLIRIETARKLKEFKPEGPTRLTTSRRKELIAELLAASNNSVTEASELLKELNNFIDDLNNEYQKLMAAANALAAVSTESAIIIGDFKQKPISYYVEEACQILYELKIHQDLLDINLNHIDLTNAQSFKQFELSICLPPDLSACLDRYLLYSSFLLPNK